MASRSSTRFDAWLSEPGGRAIGDAIPGPPDGVDSNLLVLPAVFLSGREHVSPATDYRETSTTSIGQRSLASEETVAAARGVARNLYPIPNVARGRAVTDPEFP